MSERDFRARSSSAGDAHPQLRQEVDRFGIGPHLRFDPRRREQEVDNRGLGLSERSEPDRREPHDGLLLDDSLEAVFMGTQVVDEGFGLECCASRQVSERAYCPFAS